jgi:ribosome-interacting GTPase 1
MQMPRIYYNVTIDLKNGNRKSTFRFCNKDGNNSAAELLATTDFLKDKVNKLFADYHLEDAEVTVKTDITPDMHDNIGELLKEIDNALEYAVSSDLDA